MKLTKTQLRKIIKEELQKMNESVYDAFGSIYGAFSSKKTTGNGKKMKNMKYADMLDGVTKDEIIQLILKQRRNTLSKANLQNQSLGQLKAYYLEIR